jgi:threonine dehydrogenase-like Zn-dependent dehydrogenase
MFSPPVCLLSCYSSIERDNVCACSSSNIGVAGWHGVEISGFQSGESIAVFGAGPVGLMAAYSAVLRGGSNIYVVDRVPERLRAAEKIGCIPIDFTKGDAVDQIIAHNGDMVDRSVDAVGYQAVNPNGNSERPNIVLENMIRVTRPCGGLGIAGLYVPRYDALYHTLFVSSPDL